jgi:hypothetical protein
MTLVLKILGSPSSLTSFRRQPNIELGANSNFLEFWCRKEFGSSFTECQDWSRVGPHRKRGPGSTEGGEGLLDMAVWDLFSKNFKEQERYSRSSAKIF